MPKKKRVWYPGAVYHIMNRGNRRSDIFRDEEDFQVYITILREAKKRYSFTIYSYCMMTNHVHLQIETGEIDIGKIMRFISLSYVKYFNNKYNYEGHLYQGRYRSEIINNDAYNLQTSRYVHLNPVKAAMVTEPLKYKWSSYDVYMGYREDDLIKTDKILGYFKNYDKQLYKEYVESDLINRDIDNEIAKKMEVE